MPSIIDDSVIKCDEILEETKTITTNFHEKIHSVKQKKIYISVVFLLITIVLLIAVSIYCYLIKYKSKQKHLLPHYVTNDKLINDKLKDIDSIDALKEIDIKHHTCYYFDDIIRIEDLIIDNISTDKKPYEKFLVYNISYKSLIDAKPLRIMHDKIDGFIRVYDSTRYLVLFSII